jgi:hypothetical protein
MLNQFYFLEINLSLKTSSNDPFLAGLLGGCMFSTTIENYFLFISSLIIYNRFLSGSA